MTTMELESKIARLQSENAALSELLAVHEQAVLEQSDRIEHTLGELRERSGKLEQAESRIRSILNSVPDGIVTVDHSGIIEGINRSIEKMFGYTEDDVVGQNVAVLMPVQHRGEHDEYLKRYRARGPCKTIDRVREVVGRRSDGSTFPIELRVSETTIGDSRLLTGIVHDISRRREAEANLRRFRAAIDTSADGIFLIDCVAMRFVDASISACASVGYARDELLTMGPHDIKPHYNREQLAAKFDEIIAARQTTGVIETEHQRKDGSRFPVEVLLRFLEHDGQRIVVAVARDFTERKRAEKRLEELNGQLVEASRQAGMAEIATGVLHNVGNVLNSVNVSATVLMQGLRSSKLSNLERTTRMIHAHAHDMASFISDDEKGKRLPDYLTKLTEHLLSERNALLMELESLTRNVEHITSIITAQQAHAGVYGVASESLLSRVMDDALTINATSFARYGIEVVRDYADLPPLHIDQHRLLQILVNLIRNAKHAMLDGSQENNTLSLRIAQQGKTAVRIEVSDTGVGIAPEDLTRVFAHGFTTKKNGHGFGLHSSALAAREMGGSLSAHSDGLGRGATFALELPMGRRIQSAAEGE